MEPENVELVLFGTDSALLTKLSCFSTDLPYVRYESGYGPQVVARVGLDALWVTPMAGVELFGAVPPFPLHEARVLETPLTQRKRGMPRYGIVGVATSEDDPNTPEYGLRVVLSALLRTVGEFNREHSEQIRRVGILPVDLGLERLDPATAFGIVREIYEQSVQQK
jgi:hypothetical protein